MRNKIIALIAVIALCIGAIGTTQASAASVYLSTSSKTIYTGSIFKLELNNAKGNVKWTSSDEKVAQVLPSGYVAGIKKGSAVIMATYDGVAYGCTIKVKSSALNKSKATIHPADTLRLKMSGSNPISWKSSDKTVATVDEGGLVTAKTVGTAKITVSCEDGKTYTCKLTVANNKLKVGDSVTMGTYEQDNDEYNGAEPIKWTVIDVKDGNALILADCILEIMKFGSSNPRWDDSIVRTWLNSDFKNNFTDKEKKKIITSTVKADLNPDYPTVDQGSTTRDDIFLLSYAEVQKYGRAACQASVYANTTEYWWTRTANTPDYGVVLISTTGYKNKYYYYFSYGVRPAMWIKID